MLRPLGIKVFNLCIQTNSLLSLMDFDLGISLGNLMNSWICVIILAVRALVWQMRGIGFESHWGKIPFSVSQKCSKELFHNFHTRICLITVALKTSSHCSIVSVFDVKYMTLESINNPVFGLTYILYVAPSALQTVYEIVTLACAFSYCVVDCIIVELCYFPWLGESCTILTSIGSCTTLGCGTPWLWYLCPDQYVFQWRRFSIYDNNVSSA